MSATMEPYKSLGDCIAVRPERSHGERPPKMNYRRPSLRAATFAELQPLFALWPSSKERAWEARQARIAELRSRVRTVI